MKKKKNKYNVDYNVDEVYYQTLLTEPKWLSQC